MSETNLVALGVIQSTEKVERLMKRCQIGTSGRNALDTAHDILAECYSVLGSLVQERDMLRTGDTCARQCEGTAYRIEARRQKYLADEIDQLRTAIRRAQEYAQDVAAKKYHPEYVSGVLHIADLLTPNKEGIDDE